MAGAEAWRLACQSLRKELEHVIRHGWWAVLYSSQGVSGCLLYKVQREWQPRKFLNHNHVLWTTCGHTGSRLCQFNYGCRLQIGADGHGLQCGCQIFGGYRELFHCCGQLCNGGLTHANIQRVYHSYVWDLWVQQRKGWESQEPGEDAQQRRPGRDMQHR